MRPRVTELAGLYIHVPFCTSVCPYCDFAVTIAGEERRRAWADGVVREAAIHADLELSFDTVYLGGGTPSALDPGAISQIIEDLKDLLTINDDAVVHLEANPEDVAPDTIRVWKELGVDFVSLGVQSFDDRELRFLGRRHTAADAESAVRSLLEAEFHTVSVDLIYGLAGQSLDSWRSRIHTAAGLGVHHLSCYQLTVHGRTVFGRRAEAGASLVPSDELQADLFYLTHETTAALGLPAYEVSNFSSGPEHRSRHNQKYWDLSPYLGLGPSAHSFAGGRRWWNRRKVRLWQRSLDEGVAPIEGWEIPTPEQSLLELVMLGLRTVDGFGLDDVRRRFHVDLVDSNQLLIRELCGTGYLELKGERLRPTRVGLAVADTLARSFDLTGAQTIGTGPT